MRPPEPFTARPATPGDASDVAALICVFDGTHLEEPDVVDAAEVGGWWKRLDLARDSVLVAGPGGTLVAYGTLDAEVTQALDLDAYVHPEHLGLGLGSFLLDWAEEETGRRGRPIVRTSALAADRAAKRLVESRGFVPVRHFYRMLADLGAPPLEPELPEGFTVSTFQPGEEEVLRSVLEEAFGDHWGHETRSPEMWQTTVFGREWWDPTLVHLIREGDEVVAASVNAIRFGVGWIGQLGTRAPWRGRGLGRALLLLAFGELYRRGERRIGLAVDAGNETGATHLYETVGMRVSWQADVYEKRV